MSSRDAARDSVFRKRHREALTQAGRDATAPDEAAASALAILREHDRPDQWQPPYGPVWDRVYFMDNAGRAYVTRLRGALARARAALEEVESHG